ncbi:MAG: PDDEXK nuclease domain-containing protein [Betaproteobacteria bacterium]
MSSLTPPDQTPSPFTFEQTVSAITTAHRQLISQAGKAVNLALTLRNWLIGGYIQEFEQAGSDRASYGTHLLETIAEQLAAKAIPGVAVRSLRIYRQFYLAYPAIRQTVSAELPGLFPNAEKRQTLSADSAKTSLEAGQLPIDRLLSTLSFSHFVELLQIDDSLKRSFYELECVRGNWSLRELKRQIGSLYFERSGLSTDQKTLSEQTHRSAETQSALAIRDPYVFEFLGIKSQEVMGETALEDALLDKLSEFLLELGHGFCFEARQKRILIGDQHYFVDLVFYHRILKCHVLLELKLAGFNHQHIGQLNTYVNWYKRHMTEPDDNPPIGLLLCAHKDQALLEYAMAGMDNQLFVSRYQLELPSRETLQKFLEQHLKNT